MGLDVTAKGMTREQGWHRTYGAFFMLRAAIADAYHPEIGRLYRKNDITDEEVSVWNALCNDDLDIFLLHSDTSGKLTPEECKKIYKALEGIHLSQEKIGALDDSLESWLDHWKSMLRYSIKRRVILRFG